MNCTETLRLGTPPYPTHLVRASRNLLNHTAPLLRQEPRTVLLAREMLRRYPEHRAHTEAAAGALGGDPLDLMLATLSYDLLMGMYGCSTMVLATDEGPLVARNMDWSPEDLIARASCVVPTANGLNAGFVGAPGVVTGLSKRGFAVVLNAVGCERLDPAGYPMLLFLRHLIDHASDFDDAVRLCSTTPLLASGLLTLAGTRNDQRVVVERAPSRFALRRPEGNRPLVTTNHYLALHAGGDCCDRFRSLSRWAADLPSRQADEDLLGVLLRPPLYNSITAQHIIMRPAAGTMRMWVPTPLLAGAEHAHAGTAWVQTLLN
jgi:hypothetical protein